MESVSIAEPGRISELRVVPMDEPRGVPADELRELSIDEPNLVFINGSKVIFKNEPDRVPRFNGQLSNANP